MSRAYPRMLLAAVAAAALTASTAAQADSACLSDIQRYCSQIPIGEGRVLTCLQARWANLSSACQQEIQKIQARAREVDMACSNDVWSFCQGVAPGADRIRVCLASRWDDLSSTCRDKVAELSEKAEKLRQNCSADAERLCPGLKPGGGQLWLCLKALQSRTSGACQAALR